MSARDISTHLNIDYKNDWNGSLYSKLYRTLDQLKQPRGGAAQWRGIINGFSQKGVKSAEIADSGVIDYLANFPENAKVEKTDLLDFIEQRLPSIKRVQLASPKFRSYTNIPDGQYTENLYILSSERMRAEDQIEDLLFRIEELGFDPSPILEDPEIVDRLEKEMKSLIDRKGAMWDFQNHHFSSRMGNHGKNLLAHARTNIRNGLFFVEEIQSDWAQQGRSSNWASNYPKAPFVENTELWAGVVLRDLLNTAAREPSCQNFAWIRASMRNGFNGSGGDDLAAFYDTIIRKLVEKSISKAGGKIAELKVMTKNGERSVLGFEMTDAVRESLKVKQPLYSRDNFQTFSAGGIGELSATKADDMECIKHDFNHMLGTGHTVRFMQHVFDIAQGREVPGKYFNRVIDLSLRSENLTRVSDHEAWHFAEDCFLFPHEKRAMRLAFTYGSELNERTIEALKKYQLHDAADQSKNHSECAAHAFSLWRAGLLKLEPQVDSLFSKVTKAFKQITDWVGAAIYGEKPANAAELFKALNNGALARRAAAHQSAPRDCGHAIALIHRS